MTDPKPQYPGRTPAQRRALDAIGCGDPLQVHRTATPHITGRVVLLKAIP